MISRGPRCCVSTNTMSTTTPMPASAAHHVHGLARRGLGIRYFGDAGLVLLALAARLDGLYDHRHHRDQHDGDHNQGKVLANERNVPEEVSSKREERRPDDAAEDVVGDEGGIRHLANTGDERCK